MTLQSELLCTIAITVDPKFQEVGSATWGQRRIVQVAGGTFEGPRLKGRVLPGGGDWILTRPDGVTQLDVRITLETDDGALIYMTYRGLRHGPPEVLARLARGERVEPSEYYFRTVPCFETASEKYGWLNRALFVSTGDRLPPGPIYTVYEIL
jgi:hypothetical protein